MSEISVSEASKLCFNFWLFSYSFEFFYNQKTMTQSQERGKENAAGAN